MISLANFSPDKHEHKTDAETKPPVRKRKSMNAVKSGLFSKEILIKTEFYSEDAEAYESTRLSVRETFRPQNRFEEDLCDLLAGEVHCLRRGQKYETKVVEDEIGCEEILSSQRENIEKLKKQIADAKPHQKSYRQNLKLIEEFRNNTLSLLDLDKATEGGTLRLLKAKAGGEFSMNDQRSFVIATKLNRLEFFFLERFKWDRNQLAEILAEDPRAKLRKCTSMIAELKRSRRRAERSYRAYMQDGARRHLLPPLEDQERLERFYAMRMRKLDKLTDILLKIKLAGARLLQDESINARPSLPSHGGTKEVRCSSTEILNHLDSHN